MDEMNEFFQYISGDQFKKKKKRKHKSLAAGSSFINKYNKKRWKLERRITRDAASNDTGEKEAD